MTSTNVPNVIDLMNDVWALQEALRFYADKRRYEGPNLPPIEGDKYAPSDLVYRYDVTRDNGFIAREALAKVKS